MTVYIKLAEGRLCDKVLQELYQIGVLLQNYLGDYFWGLTQPEDFEKLHPLLEVFGDRVEPLISRSIQLFSTRGWGVNLKSVAELIKLGYNVNDDQRTLKLVFRKQGSSSDLFKFLEENGATMESITSYDWYKAVWYLDTDLREGINKAELAVRLSDFFGHGLRDANLSQQTQKNLLYVARELTEFELITLGRWWLHSGKTRQKMSLFPDVAKFI